MPLYLDRLRLSPGLLDGATDIIGGDPLQEPVITDYTVNAEGHIIIPAEDGGGAVTWVRGVWDYGTQFRYQDFMAGTTDPDAVNYMAADSNAVATNLFLDGVYSTKLEPDWPGIPPAEGTPVHVRFSRRSGEFLPKGSPINGWPYNYTDPNYLGTAVDGDMYVIWACELAFKATGQVKYHNLAVRIAKANLEAGRWKGNEINFGIPFYAEVGQTGLYSYNADLTPFSWEVVERTDKEGNCLQVQTQVLSGGPPYNYSGWGAWPAWKVTGDEPFNGFSFEFDGGGCGRNIELSTSVVTNNPTGDVSLLIPCLTSSAGTFTQYHLTSSDFWRLDNIVWEHQHKEPYWTSVTNGEFSNIELENSLALGYNFDFNLVPVYGNNLVTNGDFSNDLTGWNTSANSGTITITDGICTLTHTPSRARLRKQLYVEIGKTYLIEFLCSNFIIPEPFIDIGIAAGSGSYQGNVVCNNGLNAITITAVGPELWLNFFTQTSGRSYSVDNVSVREAIAPLEVSYGDIGINTSNCSSTGTSVLHFDILSTVSGTLRLKIRDNNSVTFTKNLLLSENVRETFSILWSEFTAIAHPVNLITIQPLDTAIGQYMLFGCWFDNIVTAADLPINTFDGFEFQFPSYDSGPDYDVKFANIVLDIDLIDGTVTDRQRYAGLPRWTYKWTQNARNYVGYGTWRGWTGAGYLWLAGWSKLGIVNPDNGNDMAVMMRNFMEDAQNEYAANYGHLGPFMPRYGRAAWDSLNQEGVVGPTGSFTDNIYNKWFFPWNDTLGTGPEVAQSDDWYGYTCRAILSCASDYFVKPTAQIKSVLDNWVAWFNLGEDTQSRPVTKTTDPSGFWTYTDTGLPVRGIVWDSNRWRPPSEYRADGRVRYHYSPVYAWTCIAQAMLFKYWADGDSKALVWMRRLLDYLDTRRITAEGTVELTIREADDSGTRDVLASSGSLVVVQRGEEGSGYTTATVTITGDGTGAEVVPRIFAGRIRFYEILNIGTGYTHISGTVSGDGTGATIALALYQQVVGAFDLYHTGWEIWEIYNTYAMLVLGSHPDGTVNFATTPTANDIETVTQLEAFFARNTTDNYPMMQLANGLPMHEYGGWDPYHNNSGIENPMIRDSRTRGKLWTESSGPAMRAAVLYRLLHE